MQYSFFRVLHLCTEGGYRQSYAVHSYMQLKLYHCSDINITIQSVRLAEK